jgi:hypothetical protein
MENAEKKSNVVNFDDERVEDTACLEQSSG